MSLHSTHNIASKFSLFGSLNPGPVQISPSVNTNIWESLNKKGLHFLQININSFLPKINELKCVANKTKATIFGIIESKLDHTVPDHEVNLPGYDILWCDINRNGGGIACYISIYVLIQQLTYFYESQDRLI